MISRVASALTGGAVASQAGYYAQRWAPDEPPDWDTLLAYYQNNGLYNQMLVGIKAAGYWTESLRPIRNPANAVVEFYAATLWPGTLPDALPIVAVNAAIVEPIRQVWKWSNWSAQKQVAARWLALYGNVFIKATTGNQDAEVDKAYLQIIEPSRVPDYDLDERGYVTHIRIDTPVEDQGQERTHTEIWDKTNGYRLWVHNQSEDASEEQMGDPKEMRPLSDFGIDFVPVVHCKFKDVGSERGVGSFEHALDPIDEVNRQATRLHQMLFRHNKATWALQANGMDAAGRPLPAPVVNNRGTGVGASDTLELGDDAMIRLPGNSQLESLVPNINYDSALKILEAQIEFIKRNYLPELAWYDLISNSQASGRAIRLMLTAATARVLEARGNAEAALARADAMALTLGVKASLFSDIGEYANGGFDHVFAPRPVIVVDGLEQAQEAQAWTAAGAPLETAARWAGKSAEEITKMNDEQSAASGRAQTGLAQALVEAQRKFDQGGQA